MTNIQLQSANAHISMSREVVNHLTSINWEQRRYEIAKDVLAGFAASDRGVLIADAQVAVKFADALIKALKG